MYYNVEYSCLCEGKEKGFIFITRWNMLYYFVYFESNKLYYFNFTCVFFEIQVL